MWAQYIRHHCGFRTVYRLSRYGQWHPGMFCCNDRTGWSLGTVGVGDCGGTQPGALGMLVSIFAVWCVNDLRSRCEVLEMKWRPQNVRWSRTSRRTRNGAENVHTCLWQKEFLTAGSASAGGSWEVPYDRQRPLLLAFWCCALYVALLLAHAWS